MAQSGRNSGGDLFDMAKDGTKVPEDAAAPRYIPSVPRPDQIASETDPNDLGARNLADAAGEGDIPRTTRDTRASDVITGTGDTLPGTVDSKRLHAVPGGVTQDPFAKGSTRMTAHKKQDSDFEKGASDGPQVERAPGQEDPEELSDEQVMDNLERKE
ncbi:hypothetical protein LTR10_022704 [Elasticomyces elasticus]|uniref:Histone chaperone domain-containing protein n=1 Tax=Exophiala sideris TaxID=1016849 RepID=A0ABR0JNE2_9EURO|nr:hypothetical protein LTR10_022704 [Elasticomyces elasticus]KAK5036576.1 hypothetical protein LTS07_002303 [Exophiala sideris]KAK5041594.1 hypothetical protein LTR13_002261 [Exophiala sideris]KAK5066959.1 hypothetical protein LTR69_002307 [Exophiala sideris]KAK5185018.1 hypothetical protein LTR44_002864 [Eurotiomycetes sp. CCFEE 6388]